ncbi:MAG: efflux RND transporter periplasmic adaptor subunit [Planctomycetota bacterium]|jgi:membrane fusion protein (multidrug efflux system)|nr:efflux RND transporter periplasmic adaptor subunit [Planctomycetota bacterium]
MEKRARFAATLFLTASLLAGRDESAGGDPSGQTPPLPRVGVITLKAEAVTISQELNGRVAPFAIAEVRPQVNGIILRRLFEEGSDVLRDMQLYQIDPALYEAQLNRAEAGLAKAKANVSVAEAKLARYRRLIQAKAVNQQEYDEVEAASKQAEADVGIAEAEVRLARINVDYAKVRSPIAGRIGKSLATQGALVTASQSAPLAVVQQLDPIYVDIAQPVSWVLELQESLRAGVLQNTGESHAEVRLTLDNGQAYGERGKLLFADVTVDQSTGSISLRAEFSNPNHTLLPGMYVTAILDLARKDDAIAIPQRALFRDAGGEAFALLVAGDGGVERRRVVPLRALTGKWLIGEGLSPGERVVVDGFHFIRFAPGGPAPRVEPVEAEN